MHLSNNQMFNKVVLYKLKCLLLSDCYWPQL